MPNRFVPAATLEPEVALRILRPVVDQAADRIRNGAQRGAPAVKVWVTAHDERVRKSHIKTDGQAIPANVPFKIPKVNTGDDANDIRAGHDLAMHPRDPSLPVGNRINCRCADPAIPDLLRKTIHASPAVVVGTRVTATVATEFPRAAESEFADDGGRWMRNPLMLETARWRR